MVGMGSVKSATRRSVETEVKRRNIPAKMTNQTTFLPLNLERAMRISGSKLVIDPKAMLMKDFGSARILYEIDSILNNIGDVTVMKFEVVESSQ